MAEAAASTALRFHPAGIASCFSRHPGKDDPMSTLTPSDVKIRGEFTPDPDVCRFTVNQPLLEEGAAIKKEVEVTIRRGLDSGHAVNGAQVLREFLGDDFRRLAQSAGQLEGEILNNTWLNTPINHGVLFGLPPPERWLAATQLLGLDISHLASQAGHA